MATVTKKLNFTGSAYTVTVSSVNNGTIKVSVQVHGVKQSSTVFYSITLHRGADEISSIPRESTVGPQKTKSVYFTNVMNHGNLNVWIYMQKRGGSGGGDSFGIKVPK